MLAVTKNRPARDRLLEAGAELIAERGYEAVSVREICKRAGTTINMIHHYFGSKEGLLDAILKDYGEGILAVPTRLLEKPPASREDFVARFELLFETTFEAYIEHRVGLLVALRVQAPVEALDRYTERFIGFVECGKALGVVRASLEPAMITGAILDRILNQVHFAPFIKKTTGVDVLTDQAYQRRWCKANIDLFLHGIVA
jgi:AcrR family transcriptional regulator